MTSIPIIDGDRFHPPRRVVTDSAAFSLATRIEVVVTFDVRWLIRVG